MICTLLFTMNSTRLNSKERTVCRYATSPMEFNQMESSSKIENTGFFCRQCASTYILLIEENLLRHNVTGLKQPPYSPDLAPAKFYWFCLLEINSNIKRCKYSHDVITKVTEQLKFSKNGLQEYFQKFNKWLQKCVAAKGNNFGKNTEWNILI